MGELGGYGGYVEMKMICVCDKKFRRGSKEGGVYFL